MPIVFRIILNLRKLLRNTCDQMRYISLVYRRDTRANKKFNPNETKYLIRFREPLWGRQFSDDASRICRVIQIMQDNYDTLTLVARTPMQFPHQPSCISQVQIFQRLIQHDPIGILRIGHCHKRTLPLSTGKLIQKLISQILQLNGCQWNDDSPYSFAK